MVATGSRKSVNDGYRARKEQVTVSIISVYNKLNGVETEVSRQMIRQTAMRMAEVVRRPGRGSWSGHETGDDLGLLFGR